MVIRLKEIFQLVKFVRTPKLVLCTKSVRERR